MYLTVNSLPIQEVIKDLATALATNFEIRCNFYKVSLPNKLGEGYVRGIDFGSGFGMLNYDCKFYQDTTISFTFNKVHPMKFLHCHQGQFRHTFEHAHQDHEVSQYENLIVASDTQNGHVLHFEAGKKIQICSIEIDRKRFIDKIDCIVQAENDPLLRAIRDTSGQRQFFHKGHFSLMVSKIVQDLLAERPSDLVDTFYSEGKCYEMLALQWDQFSKDSTHLEHSRLIQKRDVELLKQMVDYLEAKMDQQTTVKQVAKQFGTNEKKIQQLFKLAYGMTFNQFIQEMRLEKSLKLLRNPDYNVSEVVYAIGLRNRSYFSRMFKQRFGVTPSEFSGRE